MNNPVARQAKVKARRANRLVKRAATHPWFHRLARLGYVVRGALYVMMGFFALGLALNGVGSPADQRGVLYEFARGPVGVILLLIVIVAVAAYSLWGFFRAIYDPLNRGDSPGGIVSRLGFAWSGLNYAAFLVFGAGFLTGTTKNNGSDSVPQLVGTVLSHSGGRVVITIAGVIGVIAGLGQFVDAYKATFRKDLKRNTMSTAERVVVDGLGRFGMVSRGVIFTMLGNFVLQAGLHNSASQSHGIGVAFAEIGQEPMGRFALAIVAIGFVALGLHSFANARWVRMPTKATVQSA